jgi:hypothetical protein
MPLYDLARDELRAYHPPWSVFRYHSREGIPLHRRAKPAWAQRYPMG